jgi:hypothetical protein
MDSRVALGDQHWSSMFGPQRASWPFNTQCIPEAECNRCGAFSERLMQRLGEDLSRVRDPAWTHRPDAARKMRDLEGGTAQERRKCEDDEQHLVQ